MAKRIIPKVFTAEEQIRFLNGFNKRYPSQYRDYMICKLSLTLGLRVSEVATLSLDDISFDSKGCPVHLKECKGSKDRIVFLRDDVKEELQEYIKLNPVDNVIVHTPKDKRTKKQIEEYNNNDEKTGKIPPPKTKKYKNVIFLSKNKTILDSDNLTRMVKRISKKVGINKTGISFHTLRHSFATNLLSSTDNLITVKNALGHSSVSTTQVYTHLTDDALRRAMTEQTN